MHIIFNYNNFIFIYVRNIFIIITMNLNYLTLLNAFDINEKLIFITFFMNLNCKCFIF